MVRSLGVFNFVFAMRPIMRLGNGNIVLEFLLVMLLEMVLGSDNVVKFITK